MSLLTEQEIEDVAIFVMNADTFDIKRLEHDFARAIETKVIERIKAQGPVAEFGGLRLTPEGTNEFWGWTIGDSADVLVSGMKLYKLPEGE